MPEKFSHSTEENYAVISIVGRAKEEEVVEEEISEGEEGSEEATVDSEEEETANEE